MCSLLPQCNTGRQTYVMQQLLSSVPFLFTKITGLWIVETAELWRIQSNLEEEEEEEEEEEMMMMMMIRWTIAEVLFRIFPSYIYNSEHKRTYTKVRYNHAYYFIYTWNIGQSSQKSTWCICFWTENWKMVHILFKDREEEENCTSFTTCILRQLLSRRYY